MKTKIIEIKQNGLIDNVTAGNASNAEEFFNKVIKQQFANKDAIKATHKALMQYVNSDDAVFVLRLYFSGQKKNYKNLRRGFLSIYPNGHKLVFCDNTFNMPFAAMKLVGIAYTAEELRDYMNNPSLRCGKGTTRQERELAFYNWWDSDDSIDLNDSGWYLAHIINVGKDYNGDNPNKVFRNPDRTEWVDSDDHIRRPETNLTESELSLLKAHFLRMVHPLNSFVVPARSLLRYNGKRLGEEAELINLVQDYIKKEFPDEYKELRFIMQTPSEMPTPKIHVENITWKDYYKSK